MKPRDLVLIALFAALTAVGAMIKVPLPFTPVPITMQVLFVLMSAMLLGKKAVFSQIAYVLIGAAGLPVFAGGTGGVGALAGPSGGYLFGFIAAALIMGAIVDLKKDYNFLWLMLASVVGILVIYVFGVVQLKLVAKMSMIAAIIAGAGWFVVIDLIKAAIASSAVLAIANTGILKREH